MSHRSALYLCLSSVRALRFDDGPSSLWGRDTSRPHTAQCKQLQTPEMYGRWPCCVLDTSVWAVRHTTVAIGERKPSCDSSLPFFLFQKKKDTKKFGRIAEKPYLCSRFRERKQRIRQDAGTQRAFSSVGLEHLPYKQRVGGSNPSTPTRTHFDKSC